MPPTSKAKDHYGRNRTTTEDVHRSMEALGLYLVADGERSADGRWAAETICDVICTVVAAEKGIIEDYHQSPSRSKRLQIEEMLERAVQEACAAVHVPAMEGRKARTATAVDVLLVLKDYAISAHVGNTRLYLLSGPDPILLTRDHTLFEEMARTRREGGHLNPALKHQLTRSLGPHASVAVDTFPIPLLPGTAFLLCSNGVSDAFEQGVATLRVLRDGCPLDQLHQKLVEYAVNRGVEDNITAMVVRAGDESVSKTTHLDMRRQLDLLRKIELFNGIHHEVPALFKVLSLFDYRRIPASATIVQEGAPGDELFILLGGSADVLMGGKKVDQRAPGDALGEMAFFTRDLRSATVVATEPCVLMTLKRSVFDSLIQEDPELGYRIAEGVINELSKKLKVQSTAQAH